MKIKIIDLLNKIANGEEDDLLTEFEFDKRVWNFKRLNDSEFCLDGWLLNQNITITKHKEILEEPKKIEKLDVALLGQCDNWLRCPTNKVTKQDVELNPYIIDNIRENTLYFQRKINELIDEINNLKEK